ncbi:MAG: type II secretion system F family protein, partial [Pacificibacter sp.]
LAETGVAIMATRAALIADMNRQSAAMDTLFPKVNALLQGEAHQLLDAGLPAIDIVVRSLQAGHPLTSAIKLCAREMPDPIGSEFGILSDQLTFGSELDAGMLNMIDRVGVGELNLLAVTVSVQKGTGGNLSEILENLAQMIRDRLMIRAKIKAISAEGRITAWIMMLFPVFLFYMILFLVPTYYDQLWETGYGAYVVWGCLIMIFFGMMIIRKLINFDF